MLVDGGQFHTHAGIIAHDDLIGHPDGTHRAHDTRRAPRSRCGPTLAEYILEMPRGAQVIYPKDIGPILVLADIFPGARDPRVGRRLGRAHDRAAARDRADRVGHRLRDPRRLRAARASQNVHGFLGADVPLDVQVRDVYEGIDERELDRIVLDLPEPWRVVKHAADALRTRRHPARIPADDPPGRTPARGARLARRSAWSRRSRCCTAAWHVEGQSIRPDHRMVAHTGFLTVARRLAGDSPTTPGGE